MKIYYSVSCDIFSWPGYNLNNFDRGPQKEPTYKIWKLQALRFLTRRFLKICQNSPFLLPWQPEFCMDLNSVNNFESPSPKDHSCKVSGISDHWFSRSRCFKICLFQPMKIYYIVSCDIFSRRGYNLNNFDRGPQKESTYKIWKL